ncbi:MAG: type I-B CRISPR-associated protein Cas5b [Methanothrix sp.]|uniref:type I-B CRISPR-associated protein Cas5b n=1 Tax=Methanothrix sp. TaxID=90426 RepID=UPI0025E2A4E0|nr:type I-B CRISPR-associated protein Cas5b [Methanothrix sp.]MCQ8903782.1 type I-B CRISPR-associated protein Cas5b [Methanothrix sp.]
MQDSVLVFDVWGDYAHFRKIYTTSSPLTYSFPPRTAISGIIGAIAGLGKEEYFRYFFREHASIGCRILEPVKKVRIGENLIDTKNSMNEIKNRTQIRFEFLKDPRYRIYLRHSDERFFRDLKDMLEEHRCVYTPCLGLSQLVCNFKLVGELGMRRCGDECQEINSVVPLRCILGSPEFEEGREYFSEVMPCVMGEGREVKDYSEILYERNGRSIRARTRDAWELDNGERIVFI